MTNQKAKMKRESRTSRCPVCGDPLVPTESALRAHVRTKHGEELETMTVDIGHIGYCPPLLKDHGLWERFERGR